MKKMETTNRHELTRIRKKTIRVHWCSFVASDKENNRSYEVARTREYIITDVSF